MIKYLQNDTFERVAVVFLIQLFCLTVISKQKLKMKTWKPVALSCQSTSVLLKTRGPHFSLVWLIEFNIVSTCLGEVNFFFFFFDNFNLIMLADVQRSTYENGKRFLCVFNIVYNLFKRSFLAAPHCFIKLFHL